jgi:hypothetical protein
MSENILNITQTTIEVNGKKYRLQHPGNREWMRLKKAAVILQNNEVSVDMEKLLDYFFEHCLFQTEGEKRTLDNIPLKELEEVWSIVAPRFLGGDLESGYKYPSTIKK